MFVGLLARPGRAGAPRTGLHTDLLAVHGAVSARPARPAGYAWAGAARPAV